MEQNIHLDVIIEGCMNNDRKYQEILYKMYYNEFLSITRRYIKDSGLAQESLNNGFLKIFSKIDRFSYKGSFEGWMRKTIIRCAFDTLVRTKSYREKIIVSDVPDWHGDNNIYSGISIKNIEKIVAKLPKHTRMVFKYFADGMTHREIGVQLNISEGTSKWHLSDARKIIRESLKAQEIYGK